MSNTTADTKSAPVRFNAYGCTIATGDNWLDGEDYGGNFVATTADPRLRDDRQTEETIERATEIAAKLTAYPILRAQIRALRTALGELVNESKHYRATGKGLFFLDEAIKQADLTLDDVY